MSSLIVASCIAATFALMALLERVLPQDTARNLFGSPEAYQDLVEADLADHPSPPDLDRSDR